jgi:WD40 repeat protein
LTPTNANLIFNFNQTIYLDLVDSVFAIIILENNLLAYTKGPGLLVLNYSSGSINFLSKVHRDHIYCLVSLGNNLIATGSDDNTIKIWNVTSNECINLLAFNSSNGGHSDYVRSLIYN